MSKSSTPSVSTVRAIMDHKRAETAWIVRAVLDSAGAPKIEKLARIVRVAPVDGMGRLRVVVTDWNAGECDHYAGSASGCGYDKMTAALSGCKVGGVELGDHCDSAGRPTLSDLCRTHGWEQIGNW